MFLDFRSKCRQEVVPVHDHVDAGVDQYVEGTRPA